MSKQEEARVDIKGTLEKFVKTDEPELDQVEAIKRYGETTSKPSNNGEDDQLGGVEEQEHLKRVKQELLASLERVKQLEKKIYGDKTEIAEKNKQEAEVGSGKGKGKSQDQGERLTKHDIEDVEEEQSEDKQIER